MIYLEILKTVLWIYGAGFIGYHIGKFRIDRDEAVMMRRIHELCDCIYMKLTYSKEQGDE